MKNITVSEITDSRGPVFFPVNATLKDILHPFMANWKINNFYIVDCQEQLQGVIKKTKILEFLAPLYCTLESIAFDPELDDRLDKIRVIDLMDSRFPYLTPGQSMAEALALFVESDQNYLPLLDKKGCLLGEVSVDSLLKILPVGNRERLYAV